MKKTVFIAFLALLFTGASLSFTTSEPSPREEGNATFYSCPSGQSTIQGCVFEVDGCYFVNTINGRTISVSLYNFPAIGAGDQVSLTGNWQTDADCSNCLLNANSVTDLGDCN
ncbi:hypothetical protein AB9P05_07185 [Roseivirga sp. BDSF3-8]|uniref:hypothetical protein n=1 Tax=Roseivirga sp. BDSF3-8 TaxID=3241598 RepID=UPI003531D86A